jgi:hypothetical protein
VELEFSFGGNRELLYGSVVTEKRVMVLEEHKCIKTTILELKKMVQHLEKFCF